MPKIGKKKKQQIFIKKIKWQRECFSQKKNAQTTSYIHKMNQN